MGVVQDIKLRGDEEHPNKYQEIIEGLKSNNFKNIPQKLAHCSLISYLCRKNIPIMPKRQYLRTIVAYKDYFKDNT